MDQKSPEMQSYEQSQSYTKILVKMVIKEYIWVGRKSNLEKKYGIQKKWGKAGKLIKCKQMFITIKGKQKSSIFVCFVSRSIKLKL